MSPFGTLPDGRPAQLHTLANAAGFRAEISDYGGTVVRLFAPDRRGELADVVLGFDRVEDYVARSPYFGCLIGRVGNRIADGTFSLNGRRYTLAKNNTPGGIPCHLHGGTRGFDKVRWTAERADTTDGAGLRLHYRSADGEEGYPGNLDVTVTYRVTPDNALRIDYAATTDQPTPVNLTNHSYFNLAGHDAGTVLGHALTIHAGGYIPVNAGLIPLGRIDPVAGTPFDFRAPHTLGDRIEVANEQLRFAGGYDHNYAIDRSGEGLVPAATAFEPKTGRLLEVLTTEPGLQFYSGNFLDGSFAGKNGCIYQRRDGFCLETQHFPDAPNQPAFPSTILQPGATLRSTTIYRFSAR